jgi:hypothetical protein
VPGTTGQDQTIEVPGSPFDRLTAPQKKWLSQESLNTGFAVKLVVQIQSVKRHF